jgi:hypothetical protein
MLRRKLVVRLLEFRKCARVEWLAGRESGICVLAKLSSLFDEKTVGRKQAQRGLVLWWVVRTRFLSSKL